MDFVYIEECLGKFCVYSRYLIDIGMFWEFLILKFMLFFMGFLVSIEINSNFF